MMSDTAARILALRSEIARYARKMRDSGLVRATQGNISARDVESGLIAITPSGADYDQMSAEDIIVVDGQGEILEGHWKASLELPTHLAVYRAREDVDCVMHTHSVYASVFSVLYRPVPVILAESAYCLGAEVSVAPFQESGSEAFGALVVERLGAGSAVIWGNHGAMVVGRTIALTYSIAHALEDTAQVYWLASQMGEPRPLPPEDIERLHNSWRSAYGQRRLTDSGQDAGE